MQALTQEIPEGRFVVGHEIVNNDSPETDAGVVSLEKAGIKKQLKSFLLPGFARVLVATEAGQELSTRSEGRQIVWTARENPRPNSKLREH